MDDTVLAVAEKSTCVLATTIDAENSGFLVEATQVVGAAGVRQVMLYRYKFSGLKIKPQRQQHLLGLAHITMITTIAGKNGL